MSKTTNWTTGPGTNEGERVLTLLGQRENVEKILEPDGVVPSITEVTQEVSERTVLSS